MSIPHFQVDAFTETPFAGNPAAVCLLDEPRPEAWMRSVAREMNLSETAFVVPRKGAFGLRWFTPAVEVELCGHATLAAAHVLWQEGLAPRDAPIAFDTASGRLTGRLDGREILLDFPSDGATEVAPPPELRRALGAEIRYCGRARFDLLVEVADGEVLRGLRPDFRLLAKVPVRGVAVTARGTPPYDYLCRYFAPAAGIPEDPVTGSAQCALGPHWSARLGTPTLRAFQASARGGELRVRSAGERVELGGRAVTVTRGTLLA